MAFLHSAKIMCHAHIVVDEIVVNVTQIFGVLSGNMFEEMIFVRPFFFPACSFISRNGGNMEMSVYVLGYSHLYSQSA